MPDEFSLVQSLYPVFAPLSAPIIEHILIRFQRAKLVTSPMAAWELLRTEVQQKREIAFYYMDPFVRHHQSREPISEHREHQEHQERQERLTYSTTWLRETLMRHSPEHVQVSQDTISKWHQRGLVRYREYNVPEYTSAAAIFIARMIDKGERNFLPSVIAPDEPQWWCWRQDTPNAPVIPCPVPLPDNLPVSALLWTPWAGAAWEATWCKIGKGRGAIRWAGVTGKPQHEHWSLTYDDLSRWDEQAATVLAPLRDETMQDGEEERTGLHLAATLALHRLACSRLV